MLLSLLIIWYVLGLIGCGTLIYDEGTMTLYDILFALMVSVSGPLILFSAFSHFGILNMVLWKRK